MSLESGQQKILDKAQAILESATRRAERRDSDATIQRYVNGEKYFYTRERQSRMEEIQLVVGYAEPGYDCIDSIVAFGDWNDIQGRDPITRYYDRTIDSTPSELSTAFEAIGVEIEWNDEWAECSHCYKAVRTSPDSYSWKASFWMNDDGEMTCKDCTVEDFADEYLEWLEGNTNRAMTFNIDLETHGYHLHSGEYETGFHPGQNDDPADVAKKLGTRRFIFKIDDVGQFDATWSVYVHESVSVVDEMREASRDRLTGYLKDEGFAVYDYETTNELRKAAILNAQEN